MESKEKITTEEEDKKMKGSVEMMKDSTKEIIQKRKDKNSREVREDKNTRQPRRKRV